MPAPWSPTGAGREEIRAPVMLWTPLVAPPRSISALRMSVGLACRMGRPRYEAERRRQEWGIRRSYNALADDKHAAGILAGREISMAICKKSLPPNTEDRIVKKKQ